MLPPHDILEDQPDFYITDIDLEDEDVDDFQLILELIVSNLSIDFRDLFVEFQVKALLLLRAFLSIKFLIKSIKFFL